MNLKQITPSSESFCKDYTIKSFSLPLSIAKIDSLFDAEGEGILALLGVDYKCQNAELTLSFNNESKCKESLSEIINYCFIKLNLKKLSIKVIVNSTLYKILKDIGFISEVTLRCHFLENGVYKDVEFLSVFSGNNRGIK